MYKYYLQINNKQILIFSELKTEYYSITGTNSFLQIYA